MLKNPKFYTSTMSFSTSFYLILMPTKIITLDMQVLISSFFSDVVNYLSVPLTVINRCIPP